MNRRERIMAIVAGLALLVLAADRWLLTPMLEQRETLEAESALMAEQLLAGQRVLRTRRDSLPRWRELVGHRIPRDVSEAEGQLLHEVRSWARDARLTVRSIQPDRPQRKGEFQEVSLTVNAAGSMAAVTEFLYCLQTAEMPMHVERVRLAQSDGDELTLDVRLSTLYRAAATSAGVGAGPQGAGRQPSSLAQASVKEGGQP